MSGLFLRPAAPRPGRLVVRGAASVLAVLVLLLVAPPVARADQVRDSQWHLDYLKVAQAHRISQGQGITVAVIDTGVDANHPDLAGAVRPGADFAIRKATPPNGRVDLDGHGTAMAGLIAARGRGDRGVLGIAPKATILPVRDASYKDSRTSYTHTAIKWAVEQGADVISMSFGRAEEDFDLENAIEYARRANVVLVASAGNRPNDAAITYPAALPGVIAVGGVDQRGERANFSVTGAQVDIAAPAADVISSDAGGGYASADGTSNAAAIVAGAAALIRARYPDLSADEVAYRLTATATDKGPRGRDEQYGYGVLNLVAALTAELPPMPDDFVEPMPTRTQLTRPNVPAPMAEAERRDVSVGMLAIGAGCLLLACATIGFVVWLIVRRRR